MVRKSSFYFEFVSLKFVHEFICVGLGEAVALERDVNGSIPLHYLMCGKYANPSSALALMRQVPQCVLQARDDERLVIEVSWIFI